MIMSPATGALVRGRACMTNTLFSTPVDGDVAGELLLFLLRYAGVAGYQHAPLTEFFHQAGG